MAVTIRAAVEGDLPVLLQLYQQLSPDNTTTLDELRAGFVAMRAYPGARVFAVVEGEALLGTFTLYLLPNLTRNARPAMILENVVVDAGARRRGIGRAMLVFARAEAVAAGCYKLSLTSNAIRDGAHEFYRQCGMQQHGVSFRYDLRESPVVLGDR